jgi:hypothetical protein
MNVDELCAAIAVLAACSGAPAPKAAPAAPAPTAPPRFEVASAPQLIGKLDLYRVRYRVSR